MEGSLEDQSGQYRWGSHLKRKKKERKRMKMVKQHLFSTKEKQTKCQETPAFSLLPFYQQNCVSLGWLTHHCPVFPPPSTIHGHPTEPEKSGLHYWRRPHQVNWMGDCHPGVSRTRETQRVHCAGTHNPPVSDSSALKKIVRGECVDSTSTACSSGSYSA